MIKQTPYQRLIGLVRTRKRAYQATFDGNDGERVLMDLARFCRAQQSTFDPDPRVHAILEGRREVWLRIQDQLNLTEEEIAQYLREGVSE